MIRFITTKVIQLLPKNKHNYHMHKILQGKNQQQIKLNPKLFHLYINKLKKSEFNQRFLVTLALDCYLIKQPILYFEEIINFAMNQLEKIQKRKSLVIILNQMYRYKYSNKEAAYKLIQRAFDIQQSEETQNAYYNLKLLILTQQFIGLNHYPQQLYLKINFKIFKPITIAMVLQLFYESKLEVKYSKLIQLLVQLFVACQNFIPFADVNHLSYAIRKINNQKFRQCFYRIRKRIQKTINSTEKKQQQPQKKEWTTDQQLLEQFRNYIYNKYR